ncbi:MAG: GH116 family glycosyl-hydrolase [Spirochaetaceae bacterium]
MSNDTTDSQEQAFSRNRQYDETYGTIRDSVTSRGFPMGGLGTGGFSVFTDGGFGMFRTNHNWFQSFGPARFPKGTFLALRTEPAGDMGERGGARRDRAYGGADRGAPGGTTRILRGSFRGGREYRNVEAIAHTSFRGEVPFFDLSFEDDALPLAVRLSGFTSLIPHNEKDSTLPVAFFRLHLDNPTAKPLRASVLTAFENILGIGGSGGSALWLPADGRVRYRSRRGAYAEAAAGTTGPAAGTAGPVGWRGIALKTRRDYAANDPRRRVVGEYLVFTDADTSPDTGFSVCTRWNSASRRPRLLDVFSRGGNIESAADRRGKGAAFTVSRDVAPGKGVSIDLYILWWTPYHVVEERQRIRRLTGRHRGVDYGHSYLRSFASAREMADYCVANRERLEEETAELPRILRDATLPEWLKRYVLNATDAILVNSVVPKEGGLYTMEGVPWGWPFGALTGTIDQRLAAHPYTAAFFTDLDREELLSFVKLSVSGRVPHGNGNADIALGTANVPYGNAIKSFNETEVWTDLPQSLILQLGKLVLQTGDLPLLRRLWPDFTSMMGYLESTLENDIPEGITTYDYMHYRPSFVYSAILHLATLAMMIELGEVLQGADAAVDAGSGAAPGVAVGAHETLPEQLQRYRAQLAATERATTDLLWDDRGFFHTCRDRPTIFTSALAGDWIARFAGLSPVVAYDRAYAHSRKQHEVLVKSYRVMRTRRGTSRPLVYREANTEGREVPANHKGARLRYVNNPWQSVAYQGLEAIYLNRVDEGLSLIKRVWDKGWHEGYPWDMDHWGIRGHCYMTHPILWLWDADHYGRQGHIYMTHPALWGVFNALTGVTYNAFARRLTVSPRPLPDVRATWAGGTRVGRGMQNTPGFRDGGGQPQPRRFSVPVFLPHFWLQVEAGGPVGIRFTVLKSFGEPKTVETVKYIDPDGTGRDAHFDRAVVLRTGTSFEVEV